MKYWHDWTPVKLAYKYLDACARSQHLTTAHTEVLSQVSAQLFSELNPMGETPGLGYFLGKEIPTQVES